MTLWDIFFAFVWIGLLVIAGRYIHQRVRYFQYLHIPESVIAGSMALLLGPEIFGRIAVDLVSWFDASTSLSHSSHKLLADCWLSGGIFSEGVLTVWKNTPSVFINFIFASLLLGEHIPDLKSIWQKAAPQIVFGQVLAWGQYVVGLGVALLILVPVFQTNPMAGILIEISFEGGHAASGAMAQTMANLGFPEGGDLALGMSTVGIISGVVIGVPLAHWAQQRGIIQPFQPDLLDDSDGESKTSAVSDRAISSPAGSSATSTSTMDSMAPDSTTEERRSELMRDLQLDPITLNFGWVAIAISLGWLILKALQQLEAATWGKSGFECIAYVPLFPMTLMGGLILQLVLQQLALEALVIKSLIEHISGFVLDVMIVAAIASISFTSIGQNLPTFIGLSIAGILWNLAALLLVAPRLFPQFWFERGIGDFGQSTGVTATGLLLLRLVDPHNRSGALEAFAYKQLLFTPIVGGGLFSAVAPALVMQIGAWSMFLLTLLLLVCWLIVGVFVSPFIELR